MGKLDSWDVVGILDKLIYWVHDFIVISLNICD